MIYRAGKLSPHFLAEELCHSHTAERKSIDNRLPEDLAANALRLCEGLEAIRAVLGQPMILTSGYRCPELNRHVGGRPTSHHQFALAADFVVPTLSPVYVVGAIKKAYEEGKLGITGWNELYAEHKRFSKWVHFAAQPIAGFPEMKFGHSYWKDGTMKWDVKVLSSVVQKSLRPMEVSV